MEECGLCSYAILSYNQGYISQNMIGRYQDGCKVGGLIIERMALPGLPKVSTVVI